MANFVYTNAKKALMEGDIDLDGTDDIRVLLAMSNTTMDTEEDILNINAGQSGGPTTLDEMDGASYVRKELASEAVTADNANDEAQFDAADVTWSTLGAGTRDVQGAVVYKFTSTNDSLNVPIAWIEDGGFPITANGGDLTIQWNAEGILKLT